MNERYLIHQIDKKLIHELKLKLLYLSIFKPSEYKKAVSQIANAQSLSKELIELSANSDRRSKDYQDKSKALFDKYTSVPSNLVIIEQYKAELFIKTISKIYLVTEGEDV